MNSIKVAVVGTGFMGWVHIEALRRLGIGIAGVLGSSPEKTKAFALKTGITKAYASYEEVLADSNAGSVHLGVPNKFHFLMAKQALEAGKHVLCEKPLAMNTVESAALVAIAAKYPKQAAG
ncbi:MAG: Gfo/Idh/MocA family oxidoreductase, partial [Planctomycetota bacterium]|nr:Gfo/Idh/MocA family oxidoreductase [Planctomycetota bacterium]